MSLRICLRAGWSPRAAGSPRAAAAPRAGWVAVRTRRLALLPVLALVLPGCMAPNPPGVVARVDLDRYAGQWFEIARYPTSFQEGCVDVTAEYTLRPDGRVRVVNGCLDEGTGERREIVGTARVVEGSGNAKLKVTFFWPFEGDYWVIDLDPQYRWAVVSEPYRRYLWILARTPQLASATLESILSDLRQRGFDTDRLIYTQRTTDAAAAALRAP